MRKSTAPFFGVALDQVTATVYVTNLGGNTVSVINGAHATPTSPPAAALTDRMQQAIDRAFSESPDHPEITQEDETSL